MAKIFLFIFTNLLLCTSQDLLNDNEVCTITPGNTRMIKLSFNSIQNETDNWTDNFIAQGVSTNASKKINFNVTHYVTECEGRRVITIQGTMNGTSTIRYFDDKEEKLRFHRKCGKNVMVLDDGRILQKIDLGIGTDSSAYTNRPLKDNEIFEVSLLHRTANSNTAIGIGIVTSASSNIELQPSMYKTPIAWLYIHSNVYNNNNNVKNNYGRNLNDLKVGDTVGVMRSDAGNLHFFYNGVDQGIAKTDVPSPVYGIVELYLYGSSAIIV